MSSPTWPASLPQLPLVRGLSAQMRDSRLAFEPERGPAITRRGFSGPLKAFSLAFSLTQAQRATFEAFLEDDLAGGSLAFGMRDPNTLDIHLWQIVPGDSLFQERRVAADRVEVSMTLLRKGQPWYAPYSPEGLVLAPEWSADFEAERYASGGRPVDLSGALTATVGSINITGGALQCPGDGSRVYNTVGLNLPAVGTVVLEATASSVVGNGMLFCWIAASVRPLGLVGDLVRSSGDAVTQTAPGVVVSGQAFRAAVSWTADTRTTALGGLTISEGLTQDNWAGISPMGVGSESDGGNPFAGSVARVDVYAQSLSAAHLATLTAN